MNSMTKQLAKEITQALLDLPDPSLGETIDAWLREATTDADVEITDAYYDLCGYQPRSASSGIGYASLEALYEQEPEATEFTWLAPSPERLREVLAALHPEQIYHDFLLFADDGLQGHAFLPAFGFPPYGYRDMRQLVRYLRLIKGKGAMTPDQFEAYCQEQMEASLEEEEQAETARHRRDLPDQEPGSARGRDTEFYRALLSGDARSLDFEITFLTPDAQLRENLLQALKGLGCLWSAPESDKIEGSLEYKVWKKTETKAVGRLKDLLNRWQANGHLSWSGHRLKPLKPRQKRRNRAKRRRRAHHADGGSI